MSQAKQSIAVPINLEQAEQMVEVLTQLFENVGGSNERLDLVPLYHHLQERIAKLHKTYPSLKTSLNYRVNAAHGPYGARIWVKYEMIPSTVWERLNFFSKWGGSDKNHEGWLAWEFSDSRFQEACSYLEGYGFTRTDT